VASGHFVVFMVTGAEAQVLRTSAPL